MKLITVWSEEGQAYITGTNEYPGILVDGPTVKESQKEYRSLISYIKDMERANDEDRKKNHER